MGNSKFLDALNKEQYAVLTKKLWEIQNHKCFICEKDIDLDIQSTNAYVVANDITTCEEGKCLMISHNVRRRGVVRYDFLFVDNNISITKCNYDYDGAIKAGSDHALIEADIRT